jgi:hypothetical protein
VLGVTVTVQLIEAGARVPNGEIEKLQTIDTVGLNNHTMFRISIQQKHLTVQTIHLVDFFWFLLLFCFNLSIKKTI